MVGDTTGVNEELGIGPETGYQVAGDVVGSDQQDSGTPHTGIFNNAQYFIINGGSFYDVRGNVSHVTSGLSGMSRCPWHLHSLLFLCSYIHSNGREGPRPFRR